MGTQVGSNTNVKPRVRTQYNVDTGAIVSVSSVDAQSDSLSWIRGSETTPGWPKAIRTNTFTYQEVKISEPQGEHVTYFGTKPYIRVSGPLRGYPGVYLFNSTLPTPNQVQEVRYKSENKLLDKVKAQKVNVLVMAGERKQTAKMVASLAINAATAINLIKSRNFGDLKLMMFGASVGGFTKNAANTWLLWTYGIKPLVSDIKGSVEEIARIESQGGSKSVVRGFSRSRGEFPTNEWNVNYHWEQNSSVDVTSYARFETSVGHNLVALGLTNIPAAMYELTTLSFVLDWVLDVGGFLSRLDAAIGIRFIDGGQTVFNRSTRTTTSTSTSANGVVGYHSQVSCNRVKWASLPFPQLPQLENGFSIPRLISALALIRQRV